MANSNIEQVFAEHLHSDDIDFYPLPCIMKCDGRSPERAKAHEDGSAAGIPM